MGKICQIFGATNVHVFQADSTKIVCSVNGKQHKSLIDGPPFQEESFDRILLDAPCSVLGKRPQFANRLSPNEIKSFVPLQRKLIETVSRIQYILVVFESNKWYIGLILLYIVCL